MLSSTHTNFNIYYVYQHFHFDLLLSPDMLKRGMTNEQVQDSRKRVFLNRSLVEDKGSDGAKIKGSPNDHSFQDKFGNNVTVTEYFRNTYGIELVRLVILYHFLESNNVALTLLFCIS